MTKIRRAKPKKMATPKKKPVLRSPKNPIRAYRKGGSKSVQGSSRMKSANPSIATKIKRKVKKVVSKVQVSRLKKKQSKKKKK
jgi:hypothetical protein